MEDDVKLLNTMLKDQQEQNNVYQPTKKWRNYSQRIAHAIKSDGITNFRSNYAISKGYGDSELFDPSILLRSGSLKQRVAYQFVNNQFIKNKIIGLYLNLIRSHYKERGFYQQYYYSTEYGNWLIGFLDQFNDLPDTLIGDCREFVDIKGIRISIKYIRTLMRIYNFSKHIDFTKIKSVFEIGGGFGANAHLLLHLYPNIKKYLYLDIPPVLYVATQYLKHFYTSQVVDYLATRNSRELSFKHNEDREILSVCPWQIENIENSIELFWSGSTMQDLDMDILNNYAKHIKKLLTPKGYICLVCTVPESYDNIMSSKFGDHFNIDRIDADVEKDITSEYYIGRRSAT